MKKVVFILLLFFSLQNVYAQYNQYGKGEVGGFQVEANLGLQTELYKVGALMNSWGSSFGLEARYLFPDSPWDIGIGSRVALFKRYYEEAFPLYLSSQHFLAVDYNYRISHNFKFFAGLEQGVSAAYDLSEYNKTQNSHGINGLLVPDSQQIYTSRPFSPYIAPRIGFEAWNRLRVSFVPGFMDKGDSNVSLRLGYVF